MYRSLEPDDDDGWDATVNSALCLITLAERECVKLSLPAQSGNSHVHYLFLRPFRLAASFSPQIFPRPRPLTSTVSLHSHHPTAPPFPLFFTHTLLVAGELLARWRDPMSLARLRVWEALVSLPSERRLHALLSRSEVIAPTELHELPQIRKVSGKRAGGGNSEAARKGPLVVEVGREGKVTSGDDGVAPAEESTSGSGDKPGNGAPAAA
ncbi:MAG: hypothetical protein SGPRY_014357, partial [Prymnesium sp.]